MMRSEIQKTAPLGALIVAVFDKAACYSADPQEVSLLATQAIAHILRRARSMPHQQHTPKRQTQWT